MGFGSCLVITPKRPIEKTSPPWSLTSLRRLLVQALITLSIYACELMLLEPTVPQDNICESWSWWARSPSYELAISAMFVPVQYQYVPVTHPYLSPMTGFANLPSFKHSLDFSQERS